MTTKHITSNLATHNAHNARARNARFLFAATGIWHQAPTKLRTRHTKMCRQRSSSGAPRPVMCVGA